MLPFLNEVQNASKKYTVMFRGLNYGEGSQDGEFAETHNLSTDQYPCITQRAERVRVSDKVYTNPSTLHAKGQLLVIDGTDVFYGGNKVGEVTEGKKQTATVGNYIVIFPDKKYYKVPTEDDQDGEFGDMEETFEIKGLTFTASTISTEIAYKATYLGFNGDKISKTGANFPFNVGDVVTISGKKDVDSTKR